MTLKLVFRASARRDVSLIGESSKKHWGARQTRRYLDTLESKIAMLAENPMLGHDAELSREGLRRINSGKHAVFYRVFDRRVEIIRVLHVASNFERWV